MYVVDKMNFNTIFNLKYNRSHFNDDNMAYKFVRRYLLIEKSLMFKIFFLNKHYLEFKNPNYRLFAY